MTRHELIEERKQRDLYFQQLNKKHQASQLQIADNRHEQSAIDRGLINWWN